MNNALLLAAVACLPMTAMAVDVGTTAPPCTLISFKGGAPLELTRYRGKVVYLDFWASWCGPCAQSMSFLDELQGALASKGFHVIAVNLDENREDAEAFLSSHPVTVAVATDPDGNCPGRFGVKAMPSSCLIDRNGIIRHVQLGFRKGDSAGIRHRVEQLLNEGG